jgi:hypothetical protein
MTATVLCAITNMVSIVASRDDLATRSALIILVLPLFTHRAISLA